MQLRLLLAQCRVGTAFLGDVVDRADNFERPFRCLVEKHATVFADVAYFAVAQNNAVLNPVAPPFGQYRGHGRPDPLAQSSGWTMLKNE